MSDQVMMTRRPGRLCKLALVLRNTVVHDGAWRKRQPVSSVRKHRVSLGKRRDSRSQLAVPNDLGANPCSLSWSDFLSTLERSGILSETGLREVRDYLVQESQPRDVSALAGRLVEQGRLTEFQAHRLLVGQAKSLVFGRYVLLDTLGIGAMGAYSRPGIS